MAWGMLNAGEGQTDDFQCQIESRRRSGVPNKNIRKIVDAFALACFTPSLG